MPRFRQAHTAQGAIAALLLALVLLSGCQAVPPAEGEQSRPDPFVLGLPTPTNTPGVQVTAGVTRMPAATPTYQGTASTGTAAPTLTWTPVPTASPTAAVALTPAPAASQTATAAPQAAATTTRAIAAPTLAPTPTPQPGSPATSSPLVTPATTPSVTPSATLLPPATRTRAATVAPAGTPAPTVVATATQTPTPIPTQEDPASWNLARDVIGMWELVVDENWRYYFGFLPGGRVVVAQNGIRAYQTRGSRTLVIQMPDNEWQLTVVDLTADRLTLQGFVNETDEFRRVPGVPALASKIVGLWLDESGVYPSIQFTADGLAAGVFGRGTYEVASDSTVLLTCDRPQDCDRYRAHGQHPDTPPALRVHEVTGSTLTVEGFGSNQQWTLNYRDGIANLASGLVGRWVREPGSIEFEENGGLVVDDELYGHYELLDRSTVWIEYEGEEQSQSLVVFKLTESELALAEWGFFYEDDWWTFERSTP